MNASIIYASIAVLRVWSSDLKMLVFEHGSHESGLECYD